MKLKPFETLDIAMEPRKWEMIANAVARRLEDMLPELGYRPWETALFVVAGELKDRERLTACEKEFRDLHAAAVTLEHHLALYRTRGGEGDRGR